MTAIATYPEWMALALCGQGDNPDLFFPSHINGVADARAARKVCRKCPVRAECLEYALNDSRITGVWGGTTAAERRHIRDRQGRI